MPANNKCSKRYEEMKQKRAKMPFESSGYKFKEQRYRLEQVMAEIDRIAAVRKYRSNGYELKHCTKEDTHIFLKSIPYNLAENLGYNIVFGIDGLIGDGVDKAKVDKIKNVYTPKIERLVDDCDRVKNLLHGNIKLEYDNLKNGQSETKDLVYSAFALVDDIIIEAGI